MAEHLARSTRQRRVAILSIALAAGGIAFAYAGGGDSADRSPDGAREPSVTTGASVLGIVVTQPDALPTATPASPAPVGDSDGSEDSSPRPTVATTDTARPPASLVPPTVIENTTTTTERSPTPTIDLSTTTTESPSTTTTEVPPG